MRSFFETKENDSRNTFQTGASADYRFGLTAGAVFSDGDHRGMHHGKNV
jgi:hypothetical protein